VNDAEIGNSLTGRSQFVILSDNQISFFGGRETIKILLIPENANAHHTI
jgi:hypothetical protein